MGARNKLSQYYDAKFGTLSISRGQHKGEKALFSWDITMDCTDQACPANNFCEYERNGKCKAMTLYLKGVTNVVIGEHLDNLTEAQLFRIGMHLIPLYRTLVRMKIEELGVVRIIRADNAGKLAAHPIYKEMREQLKLIELMWKTIGLHDVACAVPLPDEGILLGKAGQSYYDRMEADALREQRAKNGLRSVK